MWTVNKNDNSKSKIEAKINDILYSKCISSMKMMTKKERNIKIIIIIIATTHWIVRTQYMYDIHVQFRVNFLFILVFSFNLFFKK